MAKNLGLGKLTVYYTVGNLSSKVIRFALFFVYTYFLTKEEIGFFDIVNNAVTLLTPILALQVYDAVLRWTISDTSPEGLKNIASSSILILIVNILFFSLVYFIVLHFVALKYSMLIYFLVIAQAFYPVILQFARGVGRNKVYVASGVLNTVILAGATIIALACFKLKVEGLFVANIAAVIATILFIYIKLNFNQYLHFGSYTKKTVREMLLYSTPLIPNSLSWWAISAADRFIILYYLGLSANGMFAIAVKFPSILIMVHTIFNMAWQEKAIRTYESEDRDSYYTSILDKYATLVFSLAVLAISITKPTLKYFVQSSYYDTWKLVPCMYLAVGFQALSSFYGSGYLSSKDTKGALFTTIFGVVTSVGLNVLLIPMIGLLSPSIAFLAGFFVMFIVRVFQTRKYFSIVFPVKKVVALIFFSIICSVIGFSENKILLFGNIIFASAICYFFNREMLWQVWGKIKGKRKVSLN